MSIQRSEDNQYYWFTPEEICLITERVQSLEDAKLVENLLAELKVADIRADTSSIPMGRLGNALGLKAGSKPLWLSSEEYEMLQKLIK